MRVMFTLARLTVAMVTTLATLAIILIFSSLFSALNVIQIFFLLKSECVWAQLRLTEQLKLYFVASNTQVRIAL